MDTKVVMKLKATNATDKETGQDSDDPNEIVKDANSQLGLMLKVGVTVLAISVCITIFSPTSFYQLTTPWAGFGMIVGFCLVCVGLASEIKKKIQSMKHTGR